MAKLPFPKHKAKISVSIITSSARSGSIVSSVVLIPNGQNPTMEDSPRKRSMPEEWLLGRHKRFSFTPSHLLRKKDILCFSSVSSSIDGKCFSPGPGNSFSLSNQCSQKQFHKKWNWFWWPHSSISANFSCTAEAYGSHAYMSFTMNEAVFVPL